MARKAKNVDTDDDFLQSIAAETGGEVLSDSGIVPYYVDLGNLALNYIASGKFINGGLPGGRVVECFGPEASGKTLVGNCFLGTIQKMNGIAAVMDCERSGSAEFAERCGHVNPKRLLTYYPVTLKQVEKQIYIFVKAIRDKYGPDKPIGILWDSIGVCPSEREWEQTDLPMNPTKQQIKEAGGNERPGERAKEANAVLRGLNPFLNENNATIYIINQERKNVGVMYGSPNTTAGGGEALKYYASLRFRFGATKEFVDKKTGRPLGVNMNIKNKKNRHTTPGLMVTDVPMFFDHGINPLGGLLGALVLAGRIEGEGKTYKVNEPWANGEDITFKNNLTDPLNPEVLYKCPQLVDAKSADEVKAYLKEWQSAIDITASDSVEKKDMESDISHLLGQDDEDE